MRKFFLSWVLILSLLAVSLPVQAQEAANPPVVPTIGARVRQIYLAGQRLGNRPDVFAEVGDSITATNEFMWNIGVGGLHLDTYTDLQPVVDFFRRSHNSFEWKGLAARGGWTTFNVLDPASAPDEICAPEESPLVCEYRILHPSVAFIMVGTNDITFGVPSDQYRQNLRTIIQTSINLGVIPILSTIPDNLTSPEAGQRVHEFNAIVMAVAREFGIPLWNYWKALQPLPNKGISGDGIHPSSPPGGEAAVFTPEGLGHGYNMRNLTGLQVLNAVWKAAIY